MCCLLTTLVMGSELHDLDTLWTTVNGLRAYARTSALPQRQSSPIVLVHGFGVSSAYFVPTAERLAAAFNVYAPDLPGHGRTQRPSDPLDIERHAHWLSQWMEVANLKPAAIVANSMGCQIAVELAIRYPHRVQRLVLIGPTLDRTARSIRASLARLLVGAAFERVRLMGILARDYLRMGIRLKEELRSMLDHRIEQRLPLVSQPVLFVRGERDPIAPQRWLDELAAVTPNSSVIVVPRWGHAVHYSAAEQLVPRMIPFLAPSGCMSRLC